MHRVEVCLKPHLPDARGLSLVRDIHDLGITTVSSVRVMDIYWLDADLPPDKLDLICRCLLADPVAQEEAELAILNQYLPQQMTREEIIVEARRVIEQVGACVEVKTGLDG